MGKWWQSLELNILELRAPHFQDKLFLVCIVTYFSHTQTASENSELEDGTMEYMEYEPSWWVQLCQIESCHMQPACCTLQPAATPSTANALATQLVNSSRLQSSIVVAEINEFFWIDTYWGRYNLFIHSKHITYYCSEILIKHKHLHSH